MGEYIYLFTVSFVLENFQKKFTQFFETINTFFESAFWAVVTSDCIKIMLASDLFAVGCRFC